MRHRPDQRSGFTLIELLIVVGIIALLVTVLTVAIIPMLSRSDRQSTISLLQQVGPVFIERADEQPSEDRFKRDLGPLKGRVDADRHIASSQMILFYVAPPRDIWDQSRKYTGTNYNPQLNPQEFGQFTRRDGDRLPYLVDAWDEPIWYEWDPQLQSGFILSKGADGVYGNEDDIIYMASGNKVSIREDMTGS